MPYKVAIVMGSKSDADTLSAAEPYLNYFAIEHETFVLSAHRTPEATAEFAKSAADNGYAAIIAGAGMAAHLPGVIASYTLCPVIGVPLAGSDLRGLDALYSIVQMPRGVPVATMAIGKAGAVNAALYVARMIALNDQGMRDKLKRFRQQGCVL